MTGYSGRRAAVQIARNHSLSCSGTGEEGPWAGVPRPYVLRLPVEFYLHLCLGHAHAAPNQPSIGAQGVNRFARSYASRYQFDAPAAGEPIRAHSR